MPGRHDTPDVPRFLNGSTLFERMQRRTDAPAAPRRDTAVPRFTHSAARDLVVVEVDAPPSDSRIRFDRAELDGQPGVVMQRRDEDGGWATIWSLPTQSVDAREGMIGWLNGQSHRWERFARMLERRGPDELTAWIFELMVMPSTAEARPPRFEPQPGHVTIDQFGNAIPGCACQPASMQQSRYRGGGYC